MKLNLTDKQKIFLEGVVRSSIFIAALKWITLFVFFYITVPIFGAILICANYTPNFISSIYEKINLSDDTLVFLMLIFFFVGYVFNTYIMAKFCGIHKYFSQFKLWKSLLILIAISILAYYLCMHTSKLDFEDEDIIAIMALVGILPSYLTYLFFNFLTKKFPTPFEQIGYFFSNKFYIDLFKKIRSKLKK